MSEDLTSTEIARQHYRTLIGALGTVPDLTNNWTADPANLEAVTTVKRTLAEIKDTKTITEVLGVIGTETFQLTQQQAQIPRQTLSYVDQSISQGYELLADDLIDRVTRDNLADGWQNKPASELVRYSVMPRLVQVTRENMGQTIYTNLVQHTEAQEQQLDMSQRELQRLNTAHALVSSLDLTT